MIFLVGIWVLALLFWPCGEASAEHAAAHCRPAPADVAFPADFPALQDHEWGFRLGGWGGVAKGLPSRHHPVIFVHGNTRDAADWDEPARSVKQRFLEAGYSRQELWALSYNGKSTKGLPLAFQCRTTNRANVSDLADFVKAVLPYTRAPKVDVIAHSIGVTVARRLLVDEDSPALRGGDNGKLPGLTHDELRTHQEAVDLYLNFVQTPHTPVSPP